MEVQWLILAKELTENEYDNTFDIRGIYHRIYNVEPDMPVQVILVMKLDTSVTEATETKEITIIVEHDTEGIVWGDRTSYRVYDIKTLLEIYPYFGLKVRNLLFKHGGNYTFKVYVERKLSEMESLLVSLKR